MTVDPRVFRDTLGRFPTGVTVVTMENGAGALHGVTIGSFTSLSLEPPLVLFSLDREALCHSAFVECRYFAVNFLAEDQSELSDIFASREDRPWEDLDYIRGETGAPILTGCVGYVECAREAVHPGGDHDIIVGRVVGLGQAAAGRPLLYFGGGYRRLNPDPI